MNNPRRNFTGRRSSENLQPEPMQEAIPGAVPLPHQLSVYDPPKIPSPATEEAKRFEQRLIHLSVAPLTYEDRGLLDKALDSLNLESVYKEAEDKFNDQEAMHASKLNTMKPRRWSYKDFVIRALLR